MNYTAILLTAGIVAIGFLSLKLTFWMVFRVMMGWMLTGTFAAYDAAKAHRKFRSDMTKVFLDPKSRD